MKNIFIIICVLFICEHTFSQSIKMVQDSGLLLFMDYPYIDFIPVNKIDTNDIISTLKTRNLKTGIQFYVNYPLDSTLQKSFIPIKVMDLKGHYENAILVPVRLIYDIIDTRPNVNNSYPIKKIVSIGGIKSSIRYHIDYTKIAKIIQISPF